MTDNFRDGGAIRAQVPLPAAFFLLASSAPQGSWATSHRKGETHENFFDQGRPGVQPGRWPGVVGRGHQLGSISRLPASRRANVRWSDDGRAINGRTNTRWSDDGRTNGRWSDDGRSNAGRSNDGRTDVRRRFYQILSRPAGLSRQYSWHGRRHDG